MTTYDRDVFKKIQEHFAKNGINIPDFKTFQAMLIGKQFAIMKIGIRSTLLYGDNPSCSWTELDKNNNFLFNNELCHSKLSLSEKLTTRYYKVRDLLHNMRFRLRRRFARE